MKDWKLYLVLLVVMVGLVLVVSHTCFEYIWHFEAIGSQGGGRIESSLMFTRE